MDGCGELLHVLQLSDSVFPTGGFSHSVGLESYARHGLLGTSRDLQRFITCALHNAGSLLLPFVTHARASDTTEACLRLDAACHACLNNHVAKRASVKQGRALLDAASEIFQRRHLRHLADALQDGRLQGHMPVAFGAVCKCLDIPQKTTSQMFMFETLRNIIASAVRLGLIGAMGGQKLQYEAQKTIPEIVEEYASLTPEEAYVCFPLLEVVQNKHDTLFSKLFYS